MVGGEEGVEEKMMNSGVDDVFVVPSAHPAVRGFPEINGTKYLIFCGMPCNFETPSGKTSASSSNLL